MSRFAMACSVLGGLLLGCGKAERPANVSRAAPDVTEPAAMPTPGEHVSAALAATDEAAPRAAPSPRMIARTAQLRVVVSDPVSTARAIGAEVEAHGGFVSDSRQWRTGDQMLASMTLRVPAADLPATLDSIRRRAIRVESESVSGEDITEQYTDLRAQLVNLQATETELRALLATVRQRTQKASDILEVFNQLSSIRGQIDRTQARLALLQRQTELATIRLELVPDALARPIATGTWRPLAVVRAAFRALLGTLQWLFEAAIWLVLYVVPIVLLLAVPAVGLWAGVRRTRRWVAARRPPPPEATPARPE